MSSSTHKSGTVSAVSLEINDESLIVNLEDGCVLSIPLVWFPRLVHATSAERHDWMLLGGGQGIHWPQLDEDISVMGLLSGTPSRESMASLTRWLEKRKNRSLPRRGL